MKSFNAKFTPPLLERVMDKRAQGLSLNTIIIGLIVLVVLVVMISVFTGFVGNTLAPTVGACQSAGRKMSERPLRHFSNRTGRIQCQLHF